MIVVVGFFANAVVTDCSAMQKRLIDTYHLVFSEYRESQKPMVRIPCFRIKVGVRKFPHKLIRPVLVDSERQVGDIDSLGA